MPVDKKRLHEGGKGWERVGKDGKGWETTKTVEKHMETAVMLHAKSASSRRVKDPWNPPAAHESCSFCLFFSMVSEGVRFARFVVPDGRPARVFFFLFVFTTVGWTPRGKIAQGECINA